MPGRFFRGGIHHGSSTNRPVEFSFFGTISKSIPEMFNSAQTAERHEITNGTALKRTQKNPQFALQEGQGEL